MHRSKTASSFPNQTGTRPLAYRNLWNIGRRNTQSGFAPENFTIFADFSVSSAISLRKSVGEPANTAPPRSVIWA